MPCIVYTKPILCAEYEAGYYKALGTQLAYLLMHREAYPKFMAPFMYYMLAYGTRSVRAQIKQIDDNDHEPTLIIGVSLI